MPMVTTSTEHIGHRRVVTITAQPGWTGEEYKQALAAADCGEDYLDWDYIENPDGSEEWTFTYRHWADE